MDLDSQKLDEILELTRENNKILRSMRRAERWNSFFRYLYWIIVIGSIFGVYYYFQPTIQKYADAVRKSTEMIQKLEQSAGSMPTDLKTLKNLLGQ